MTHRERVVEWWLAGGFVVAAGALAAVLPWGRSTSALTIGGLAALYALASRVELEVGSGRAVPEQLVFVPIVLLVPLPLVPAVVAGGFLLARLPDFVRGHEHPDRWVNALTDAWFSLGPIVVLGALAPGGPDTSHLWVYGLAFLAQAGLGTLVAIVGERYGYGVPTRDTLRAAGWSYAMDAALSPAGLVVAFAAEANELALLALIPMVWVFDLFARERRRRLEAVMDLSDAYQGTVMLMADFVEFDHRPTADHCRSVVDLVDAVAEEMCIGSVDTGLVSEGRLDLRFAALLHDVGKIAIPKEVLNKPSQLSDEEFELVKRHTIAGERMLEPMGGQLRRVASIVRSCHERWDGRGYPDGLRGEDIPLAARVVFCCDAFSAMTMDRSYRAAVEVDAALEEIRSGAGSQFDPRVASAVERVVQRDAPAPERREESAGALLATMSGGVRATWP